MRFRFFLFRNDGARNMQPTKTIPTEAIVFKSSFAPVISSHLQIFSATVLISTTLQHSSSLHQMATANEKEKEFVVVAKWNHKEEKVLVELMVDQVKKGNRLTTTFSTKAWNEIIDEFYRRTENKYTKSQFVNKFNKLRLVYREFKKLRDIPTGFGWDPVTKTVTAPDDVWDQYLKMNPKAQHFRRKGCPMFDELEIIYGDTTAGGENAGASTQGAVDTDDEILYPYAMGQDNHQADGIATEVDDDADFVGENHVRSRSKTPSRRRGSKPTTYFDQACTSFTEYYQQRLASSNKYVESEGAFSIKNCVALLSSIPNIDREVYLKAVQVITANCNWREAFMSVPEDMRIFMLTPSELEKY